MLSYPEWPPLCHPWGSRWILETGSRARWGRPRSAPAYLREEHGWFWSAWREHADILESHLWKPYIPEGDCRSDGDKYLPVNTQESLLRPAERCENEVTLNQFQHWRLKQVHYCRHYLQLHSFCNVMGSVPKQERAALLFVAFTVSILTETDFSILLSGAND